MCQHTTAEGKVGGGGRAAAGAAYSGVTFKKRCFQVAKRLFCFSA